MMLRPGDVARRREASWRGLTAESVQFTATEGFEYEFRAPCHLLIAADRGIRIKGETRVEGVVASSRRDIGRTLSFIPKGYLFRGSFLPRVLPRTGYLYVDPAMPLADPEIGFADMEFEPRLFFADPALWTTATKILGLVDSPEGISRLYPRLLTASLAIELTRLRAGDGTTASVERRACRLAAPRRLRLHERQSRPGYLAGRAGPWRLSPTHFCRSFTRSMGMPPHRYQVHQRVEHAKHLLADTERSITEVAIAAGYSASSNFATVFRRVTGESAGVSPQPAMTRPLGLAQGPREGPPRLRRSRPAVEDNYPRHAVPGACAGSAGGSRSVSGSVGRVMPPWRKLIGRAGTRRLASRRRGARAKGIEPDQGMGVPPTG
jgi:AraC family transcriptional regulator